MAAQNTACALGNKKGKKAFVKKKKKKKKKKEILEIYGICG